MPSRISQMRNGQPPQQQMLQQQPQLNEEYLKRLKIIMNSNNPSQFLAQVAETNPQFKSIMNLIANGGNQQVIFETLAKQMGYDPNFVLNKLLN